MNYRANIENDIFGLNDTLNNLSIYKKSKKMDQKVELKSQEINSQEEQAITGNSKNED